MSITPEVEIEDVGLPNFGDIRPSCHHVVQQGEAHTYSNSGTTLLMMTVKEQARIIVLDSLNVL